MGSWGHIIWALESLGPAFTLPTQDIALMQSVTSVYQGWLFGELETNLPVAIKSLRGSDREQALWVKSIQHFSLAFEPRVPMLDDSSMTDVNANKTALTEQEKTFLQAHAELLQKLVRLLLLMIRRFCPAFTDQTWDTVLRVILGLSDTLLTEPILKKELGKSSYKGNTAHEKRTEIGAYLGDTLAEPLIRLICEAFLRSGNKDSKLWTKFKVRSCRAYL